MIPRIEEIEVRPLAKLSFTGKNGRLTHEATYENGTVVAVPIKSDGTMKWFDDSKLIRK